MPEILVTSKAIVVSHPDVLGSPNDNPAVITVVESICKRTYMQVRVGLVLRRDGSFEAVSITVPGPRAVSEDEQSALDSVREQLLQMVRESSDADTPLPAEVPIAELISPQDLRYTVDRVIEIRS